MVLLRLVDWRVNHTSKREYCLPILKKDYPTGMENQKLTPTIPKMAMDLGTWNAEMDVTVERKVSKRRHST